MTKGMARRKYIGLLFILPWILGFLVLQLYPFITSLIYSFADYNIMSSPKFIGAQNYVTLLTKDREFWNSLRVTLVYTLFTVPGKLIVALLVAVLMNKNMRGVNAIRTIYYLPSLFGGSIAVSILWKLMFQNTGIINQVLGLVGIAPVKWLGNPNTAMPVIILLNMWQFGSAFVMFLAALKNVPPELYEAAEIDGAGRLKQFFSITLPQISSIIFFNVIMQTITALQSFTGPMVITNGGPLKATQVLGLKLYTEAFSYYKMGYACAISWVIFVLIMAVTGVLFRFSSMVVYYEDRGEF